MDHRTRRPLRSRRSRSTLVAIVLATALTGGLAACATAEKGFTLPADLAGVAALLKSNVGSADEGFIADNAPVSVFDESLPAIANLDPDLRAAVQAAATAAEAEGQEMSIASGWRSPAYQQTLLDEATVEYGSYDEARKWVNTAELSPHVFGRAVDIAPLDAQFWLLEHGYEYGLCQSYTNERWHFELATEPGGSCPIPKDNAAV